MVQNSVLYFLLCVEWISKHNIFINLHYSRTSIWRRASLWHIVLNFHISPVASPTLSLAITTFLFQIKITFPLWKTHKESQGSGRSWRDQFKTHSILCLDFDLSFVPVEDSSQIGLNNGRPIWSLFLSSVLSFQIWKREL